MSIQRLSKVAPLLLRASAIACCAILCAPVAQAEEIVFNIPAQPVSDALQSFSKQSGYRLLFPSRSVKALVSRPLLGQHSPEVALRALLANTPLRIASIKGRTVALTARNPQQNVVLSQIGRPVQLAALQSAPIMPTRADEPVAPQDEIVVVGTQIRGAKTTGALPVSVIGQEQMEAIGAVSGNDLFRSLPQAGDVTFNEQWLGGASSNAARGDVGTVSLRGLAQGNTLVLLNGRRMVMHPTSQTDGGIPVVSYNINAIPVGGLERVEVLRDGAAALYGSDAVAGVVNNVLQSNFQGLEMDAQYGGGEGTNLREFTFNGKYGTDFAGGRGNITLLGNYTNRTQLYTMDQSFTATANHTADVAGTPFATNVAFDSRSFSNAWGGFRASGSGNITSNGVAITNASRQFHIQPATNAGCALVLGATGTCVDDGPNNTDLADFNLKYDAAASWNNLTLTPSTQRFNIFAFVNYELSDGIEFFSELGYYYARSGYNNPPSAVLTSAPITASTTAFYNPLGAEGAGSRLPGLNISSAGLPVTLSNYAIIDAGLRDVVVKNRQFRLLGGLRGKIDSWNWESAALYSEATSRDMAEGISNTLFQAAINRTTADAYNPFNGGTLTAPSIGDGTPSSQSSIDSFIIQTTRFTKASLALADLKLSTPDLFELPGGGLGVAIGIEGRRETYSDNRDEHQDGTIKYMDSVTGITYQSDLLNNSFRPDIQGSREVFSAYAELAIPLVSPEMGIPLVRAIDIQVAGRYENYSDVGSVAKPKVAGSWDLAEGVRVRGSWSQGFRAPNLELLNTPVSEGVNGRTDYVRCEADMRAGRITSFSQCTRTLSVLNKRGGNPNLKPEESTSWSVGAVLESRFLPPEYGLLTFTVDRWQIKQKGVVGLLESSNGLLLDYLDRVNGGSGFADVVRADPTADDVAAFAGTGIAPVGEILYVNSLYENLLPLKVEGIDFGLSYQLRTESAGNFSLSFNASKLLSYYQSPSPQLQSLLDAQASGEIDGSIAISGASDLVRQGGRPRWRFSGTATWSYQGFQLGGFTQYIGSVDEVSVVDAGGNPWLVKSQMTANLYGQYTFESDFTGGTTTVQLGVRNLTDEAPPLSSAGYLASLYQPQARYWYASIKKKF